MPSSTARSRALASVLVLAAGAARAADPVIVPGGEPVAGQPVYDPAQWVQVASHVHSSTGIGKYRPEGLSRIFELGRDHGFGMAVITDHNTVAHWFDPRFTTTHGVVPVRGSEWTSQDGHATLVEYSVGGVQDVINPCDYQGECADGIDYASMVQKVQSRGGLVIVNHPTLKRHVWPENSFGADAVEVNRNLTDVYGRGGRAWWHRRLASGERMAAWGGCDWHYWIPGSDPEDEAMARDQVDGVGTHGLLPHGRDHVCVAGKATIEAWPYPAFRDAPNLVRLTEKTPAGLMAAIKGRRVMVRRSVGEAMVFLGADLDGDRKFDDAREGDVIGSGSGTVSFQARVLGGNKDDLRVIVSFAGPGGTRVEAMREVPVRGDDFAYAFRVARGRPGASFVRLELGDKGRAVSNPIFF